MVNPIKQIDHLIDFYKSGNYEPIRNQKSWWARATQTPLPKNIQAEHQRIFERAQLPNATPANVDVNGYSVVNPRIKLASPSAQNLSGEHAAWTMISDTASTLWHGKSAIPSALSSASIDLIHGTARLINAPVDTLREFRNDVNGRFNLADEFFTRGKPVEGLKLIFGSVTDAALPALPAGMGVSATLNIGSKVVHRAIPHVSGFQSFNLLQQIPNKWVEATQKIDFAGFSQATKQILDEIYHKPPAAFGVSRPIVEALNKTVSTDSITPVRFLSSAKGMPDDLKKLVDQMKVSGFPEGKRINVVKLPDGTQQALDFDSLLEAATLAGIKSVPVSIHPLANVSSTTLAEISGFTQLHGIRKFSIHDGSKFPDEVVGKVKETITQEWIRMHNSNLGF